MSAAAAAAATPSSGTSTSTMKLLVDKASQRVLYADAGKDVVDFLLSLLTMPLGAAASLLSAADADDGALGSVANVYASVQKMDDAYMQCPETTRNALIVNTSLPSGPSTRLVPTSNANTSVVYPAASAVPPCGYGYSWPPQPNLHAPTYAPPTYPPTTAPPENAAAVTLLPPPDTGLALLPPSLYRCHACYALGSPQGSTGFVQAVASYTIMDDLTVKPASNVSTVALLVTLGVKELDAVEERTVTIGRKECLEILKVALRSKTVLSDVFLPKNNLVKPKRECPSDGDDGSLAKTKKRERPAGDKDGDDGSMAKTKGLIGLVPKSWHAKIMASQFVGH